MKHTVKKDNVSRTLRRRRKKRVARCAGVWNKFRENYSALKVRKETLLARLQRAKSFCSLIQTLHVWLPSLGRLRG
jgi:hypothetical protein